MIDISKRIKKNMREKQKGITLLALVITIVVLLIIAGISISMLTGENGTIKQAGNAKLLNEIGTIKEAIDIKDIQKQEDDNYNKRQTFGTITDVLGEEYKKYDKKYAIEAGNIVYKDNKFSKDDIKILEENGIEKESKHYLIMNEATKQSKYEGREEAITLKELQDKITDKEFSGEKGKYNKAYIIEDLDLGSKWDEEGNLTDGEQWVPITEIPENTVLDGCENEINGMYINTTENKQALISINNGIIQQIVISEKNYVTSSVNEIASLCITNQGKIIECENKADVKGVEWVVAGICVKNLESGIIEKCKNYGNINGHRQVGGICAWSESNSEINDCINYGDVTAIGYCSGGIVGSGGYAYSPETFGSLKNCINYGKISANIDGAGIVRQRKWND